MTGPFFPQSPSLGHQTRGGDLEYHLPHVKGQEENEDGSSSSLLGEEFDEDTTIYARRAAQEKGIPAGEKHFIPQASPFDTQAASDGEKQGCAVSILKISLMTPLAIEIRNSKKPASAYPLSID